MLGTVPEGSTVWKSKRRRGLIKTEQEGEWKTELPWFLMINKDFLLHTFRCSVFFFFFYSCSDDERHNFPSCLKNRALHSQIPLLHPFYLWVKRMNWENEVERFNGVLVSPSFETKGVFTTLMHHWEIGKEMDKGWVERVVTLSAAAGEDKRQGPWFVFSRNPSGKNANNCRRLHQSDLDLRFCCVSALVWISVHHTFLLQ